MPRQENNAQTFWQGVNKIGACWEYPGSTVNGYGRIKVSGKKYFAHRYGYLISKGEIPSGLHVLHKCDNRACVKHWHLFLGTHENNMSDMVVKNRQAKGIKNGNAKLTKNQVLQIRVRGGNGETQKSIANDFPVCQAHISKICSFQVRSQE